MQNNGYGFDEETRMVNRKLEGLGQRFRIDSVIGGGGEESGFEIAHGLNSIGEDELGDGEKAVIKGLPSWV